MIDLNQIGGLDPDVEAKIFESELDALAWQISQEDLGFRWKVRRKKLLIARCSFEIWIAYLK